jgi:hypothetical protein
MIEATASALAPPSKVKAMTRRALGRTSTSVPRSSRGTGQVEGGPDLVADGVPDLVADGVPDLVADGVPVVVDVVVPDVAAVVVVAGLVVALMAVVLDAVGVRVALVGGGGPAAPWQPVNANTTNPRTTPRTHLDMAPSVPPHR